MAKKKKDSDKDEETSDGTVAVNDAWTGMLAISLIALVIATVYLFLDWNQYDSDAPKSSGLIGSLPKAAPKDGGVVAPKDKDNEKDKGKDAMADKKGMP